MIKSISPLAESAPTPTTPTSTRRLRPRVPPVVYTARPRSVVHINTPDSIIGDGQITASSWKPTMSASCLRAGP
ncbi:hypothetical protein PGT21_022003 [Puccinia graminis f. sp. tritici]|uniref:Uncharacterized protein n=1 Tax=Puccinia graminis f. sp. tritici TaxID=56615 RepID=A0A5B0M3Y3_PUCGR|nr:hypothetical protein PGT21_022003 [Puccinia graminis f. sp. tritici]KAA1125753.1 hypothetical protein PGTUg99_014504 [Puccinia graminis f. sp. tritici]